MSHLNIEIKARCSNHTKIRTLLQKQQAEFKGSDHQIDTYFKVNKGRLKLREGQLENFLIYYERENIDGPKQSNIILFKSSPDSTLKPILVNSCGVLVVVDKKREIYFIENVKFHLDTIEGLGTFMEIEAIDYENNIGMDKLQDQCQKYISLFEIPDTDLISVSYSDLILEQRSN